MFPLAALLAACDARTPTGSTPASGPAPTGPRTEVSAPTAIGSSSVDLPFDNRASMGWTPSNIPVNADSGKWIVVRVEGFVYDTYNGECDDLREDAGTGSSTILCPPDPGQTTVWGPLSSGGSGGVDVALQRGAVAPIASGAAPGALLALYQPPGADASVAEVLLNVHGIYNVWTHRRMNVSGGGTTFGGSNIEFGAFFLGGSQTVSVLEVPNPVKVSGPTAVTRGDSVTFTAQLTGNYRARTEAGGQAGPFWYFHSNDTTAVPNPATSYEPVDECHGSMTCRIRADRPGRMYVTEFVETQQAQNQSEPMKFGVVQEPRLVLRCDGRASVDSVVRGDDVHCEAGVEPKGSGTLELTGWNFVSTDGIRVERPGSERTESTWLGAMVVSGRITAEGTINGRATPPAGVDIDVLPRSWRSLQYPDTVIIQSQQDTVLPYPPLTATKVIGDGTMGKMEDVGFLFDPIEGDGPNRGFWFIQELPRYNERARMHINAGLSPGDPFWKAQSGPAHDQVTFPPLCGPANMHAFADFVLKHETRHYLITKAFWESPSTAATIEAMIKYLPNHDRTQPVFDNSEWQRLSAPLEEQQHAFDAESRLELDCTLRPIDH